MPGIEYLCADCGNRFRTADGEAADRRTLMCPSCGSVDLSIMTVERRRPEVIRAKEPLPSADPLRSRADGSAG
jgi:DNA-directed RNA polymerase subunit RPC12/RpoP